MNEKSKKKTFSPWDPYARKGCCLRSINKIINNNIIENEYRCNNDVNCRNYDSTLTEDDFNNYYNLKINNDTDYERSDEESYNKEDRVWQKFINLNAIRSKYNECIFSVVYLKT